MRIQAQAWSLLAVLCVAGCKGGGANNVPVLLQEVKIAADKDANDGDATPVDVLVCYDKDILDKLMNMKAAGYFSQADEMEENNPKALERFHFEVIAGSTITEEIALRSARNVGGVIFAKIRAAGNHRYRLQSGATANVRLLHSAMRVSEGEIFNTKSLIRKGMAWLF